MTQRDGNLHATVSPLRLLCRFFLTVLH